jgi:hypothetical protein
LQGAAWGALGGAVVGGIAGGIAYKPSSVTGGTNAAATAGDDLVTINVNGQNVEVPELKAQFPDILDDAGNVIHQGGTYTTKFTPAISNRGSLLPGGYAIPKSYTYGGKVNVHPHSFKHLQELGRNRPLEYRRLIGEQYQKSLHSAIDDVLSRSGPLRFNHPYTSGGNRIIFGAPGKTGPLPVVKHFSSYR